MTAISDTRGFTAAIPALRAPAPHGSLEGGGSAVESGSIIRDSAEFSQAALDKAAEKPGPKSETELSPEEQKKVAELKARDAEVKAHEQAHLSALGGAGGAAKYQYTTGPDGNRYATGGEVPVSIGESPRGPEATIQDAQRVARAAVAPARPSAADQAARAKAQQVEAKARQELQEKRENGSEDPNADTPAPVDSSQAGAAGLIDSASIKPAEGEQNPLAPAEQGEHNHAPGEFCAECAAKADQTSGNS